MPTSPSNSIDLPEPYATPSVPEQALPGAVPALLPVRWRVPALLFVATVASILVTSALDEEPFRLANGVPFTVSLLAILLTHELAHYVAARAHRVNASLPLFIPMPLLSLAGTMGAVIVMRDRIKSRNALLDIGASGPIGGMIVAIPVLLYGLAHSEVRPVTMTGWQEGQSLLYWLLKRIVLGPIPDGHDVFIGPVAEAGWVGLLVTMLNLLPVGQLDGGHVAYALFGPRQNRYSKYFRFFLLGMAVVNVGVHLWPAFHSGLTEQIELMATTSASLWFGWFVVLSVLDRFSDVGHPPTEPGELSPARRVVAIATLVLFVLLFMPTPFMSYS